jgi:hypothetical protein
MKKTKRKNKGKMPYSKKLTKKRRPKRGAKKMIVIQVIMRCRLKLINLHKKKLRSEMSKL